MPRPYTSVEADNRTAFLVQLNALLTQVSMTINSTALSSANKARLADVRAAVEDWVRELSDVAAPPKPSIAATPVAVPKALVGGTAATEVPPEPQPTAAAAEEGQEPTTGQQPQDAAAATMTATAMAAGESSAPATTTTAVANDNASTAEEGGADSDTAANGVTNTNANTTAMRNASACALGGKNITELIVLMQALFSSGLPESQRLRTLARNMARLATVRCASTITASLQHVLHLTYVAARPGGVGGGGSLSPPSSTPSSAHNSPAAVSLTRNASASAVSMADVETADVPARQLAELKEVFALLARDIRLSSRALVGCLELIGQNTDFTAAASVRLPTQLCIDAIKQSRRAQSLFQNRVAREEYARAKDALLLAAAAGDDVSAAASGAHPDASLAGLPAAAVAAESRSELSAEAEAMVAARVAALTDLWGPSLAYSIAGADDAIRTAVRFLSSVAAIEELGAPADLAALRIDVQNDLFYLCDTLPPAAKQPATATANTTNGTDISATSNGANKASAGGAAAEGEAPGPDSTPPPARSPTAQTHSSVELPSMTTVTITATNAVCDEATAATARAIATAIPLRIGFSYQAEYLVAIAERCGDEDDGRLVATRILSDAVRHLGATDPRLLAEIVASPKWRKRLLDGVLNCLVSTVPAVLSAGLDDLHTMVTTCRGALGQEVGMLYSGCVFRLLDSENSPHFVKRQILLHLITTFLHGSGNSAASGGDAATTEGSIPSAGGSGEGNMATRRRNTHAPLLLHLYRAYDLSVHAHQLNIVQQFIAALSRIVRQAPRGKFASDAAAQRAFLLQQQQGASNANNTNGSKGASPSEMLAAMQSLPSIALHGLVLTVETLARQAPLEDDSGRDVLVLLPAVPNRAAKLQEQRLVDLFNSAPRKAIQKIFSVTPEELIPPGSEEFLKACEHADLPPPATAATRDKVHRVADFLLSVSSLSPESVAEFISTPTVFSLQVCDEYMSRLGLAGRGVVEAVKELLATVQLPKEGQKIERVLEFFCAAYYRANNVPGTDRAMLFPFENEQACLLVVVSLVMLNTTLHNPKAGHHMTAVTFRKQLTRCNNDKNFPEFFLDDIFATISRQPLTEVKSIGAATVSGSAHHSTAGEGGGAVGTGGGSLIGFDALFLSGDERRRLAFGFELQRLVSETRYLIDRRYRLPPLPSRAVDWAWWCAAARDLFLCSWGPVCGVFGPAMYEGESPPEEVLVKCIHALQALMGTAASFALPTECEATMLALLRMCDYESVRNTCVVAVLNVASTSYAVHLSPRCWYAVFDLLITLRRQGSPLLVKAENVLTRVESFTRLSCEEREAAVNGSDGALGVGVGVAADATGNEPPVDTPSMAVHRVLQGVTDLLRDLPDGGGGGGDSALSAGLYFLRRALGYSAIARASAGDTPTVVHHTNLHDLAGLVLPRVLSMVRRHAANDEVLEALMTFAVDVLAATWGSFALVRCAVPLAAITGNNTNSSSNGRDGGGGAVRYVTVDTAPPALVECFNFFRQCYDVHGGADGSGGLLVKTHLLQAVKELVTRTMKAVEVGQPCRLSLYTMVSAWRRALYPLGRALSDKNSAGSEVCGLAGLILRSLVVLGCGTGSNATSRTPARVRAAVMSLLADVAYVGSMCSDVDSAQKCLSHLSAICTTALSGGHGAGVGSADSEEWGPTASAAGVGVVVATAPSGLPRGQPERLVHRMLAAMDGGPAPYAAAHALERLALLLRCEREQTRAEAVESLRTLSLQLQPGQVRALALQLAELVLEATVGHAGAHYEVPLSDPSLVSFWVLRLDVPPTMRRCSRTAFRATLPGTLGLICNDLLSVLAPAHLADVATLVMSRCLVPIIVSPNVAVFQSKSLAARSITQVAMLCLSRGAQDTVGANATAASDNTSRSGSGETVTPLACVLRCVALIIYRIQVPVDGIVPPEALHVGQDWCGDSSSSNGSGSTDASSARELTDLYTRAVAASMACLAASSPQQIAGNTRHASLSSPAAAVGSSGEGTSSINGAATDGGHDEDGAMTAAAPTPRAAAIVTDEELVQHCSFLVQILPGLPRLLHAAGPIAGDDDTAKRQLRAALQRGETASASSLSFSLSSPATVEKGWAPPPVPASVLLGGLLACARNLFAALWRGTHPYEMGRFYSLNRQLGSGHGGGANGSGSDATSGCGGFVPAKPSAALLPHAAVRGVLNTYVELALRTPAYPMAALMAVAADVLAGVGALQASTTTQQQQQQQQSSSSSLSVAPSAAPEMHQRLSPQEQQHMRTCTVGMYQELSVVLSYWIRLFIQPAPQQQQQQHKKDQEKDGEQEGSVVAVRREELRRHALSPQLFSALVDLLTPTAGTLIVTVRDYFAWYIVQQQLEARPPPAELLLPTNAATTTAATGGGGGASSGRRSGPGVAKPTSLAPAAGLVLSAAAPNGSDHHTDDSNGGVSQLSSGSNWHAGAAAAAVTGEDAVRITEISLL